MIVYLILILILSGKLTVPVVSDDQRLLPKWNHVTRRPSSASLMSVVNMGGEHLIRICKDCHVLLRRRDDLIEQKKHRPVVSQLYEVCMISLSNRGRFQCMESTISMHRTN